MPGGDPAAAELLDGYETTTHWAFVPCLEAFKLVELLTSCEIAQQVQQFAQYYPAPPVASVIQPADGCPLDEVP